MVTSLLRPSPAISDFTSVVIWLPEAAHAVLAPTFCSSAGEPLMGCGVVRSSALFALSALSATVGVAGFPLVSAADPVRVTVSLVAIALVLASARWRL